MSTKNQTTGAATSNESQEIIDARGARNAAQKAQRKAEKAYGAFHDSITGKANAAQKEELSRLEAALTAAKEQHSTAKKSLDKLLRQAKAGGDVAPVIDERVQALGEERGGFTGRDTPELEDMRWLEDQIGRKPSDAEISLFTVAMLDGAKAQLAKELYGLGDEQPARTVDTSEAQEPAAPVDEAAFLAPSELEPGQPAEAQEPAADTFGSEHGAISPSYDHAAALEQLRTEQDAELSAAAQDAAEKAMASLRSAPPGALAGFVMQDALGVSRRDGETVEELLRRVNGPTSPDVAPEPAEAPAPASSPKPAVSAAASAAAAAIADELEGPEANAELEAKVRAFSEISLRERAAALTFAKVRGAEGGDSDARQAHNNVLGELRRARATMEELGEELALRASLPGASPILVAAATYATTSRAQRAAFNEHTKATKAVKAKPGDESATAWEKRARAAYNEAYSAMRVARTGIEEACGVRSKPAAQPASAPKSDGVSRADREKLLLIASALGAERAIDVLLDALGALSQDQIAELPTEALRGCSELLKARQEKRAEMQREITAIINDGADD